MSVAWSTLFGTAQSWLGVPYLYGGISKLGVDCSGFTQAVYEAATGINIGRTTTQQLQSGSTVGQDGNWALDTSLLQPGDLIFYGQPGASGPNAHVVMYAGNNQVIQAGGSNVNLTSLFQSASADEPFLGVRRYTQVTGGPSGATGASQLGPAGNTSAPNYSGSWQEQFLSDLGVPVNATNLTALTLWAQSEGTTASNNPLAASGSGQGATSCIAQCGTSSPIMAYDTIADGVAHDVAFLQGNSNYNSVIAAFEGTNDVNNQPNPAGLTTVWDAINHSSWCSGCQGGQYPNALFGVLGQTQTQLASFWSNLGSAFGSYIGGPAGGVVGGAVGSASSLSGVLGSAGTILGDLANPGWWERLLIFAGGLVLFAGGAALFLSTTKTGKTVETTAATGAMAGALA